MLAPFRWNRSEISGALGDIGTLLPLASLLITVNHLNPSAVFGIVGALYVASGFYYRVPMSVQPLKSFTALAIGLGLGASTIAAGTMVMGFVLLLLALTGLADWIATAIPKSLVRGIQLGVGLILVKTGVKMGFDPIPGEASWLSPVLAVGTGLILLSLMKSDRFPAGLVAVAGGVLAGIALFGAPSITFGTVTPEPSLPPASEWWSATVLLVLPQLPLTLANSVSATRDVARQYFPNGAERVTGKALTMGLGAANLVAGGLGGMPVCHGSGGVTAHVKFGAKTGGASILIGALLLVLALGFGPALGEISNVIPRPVLGALLVYVGVTHALLIRDVRGFSAWSVVLATGIVGGVTNHNGYGLAAGFLVLGLGWFFERRKAKA